jgi:hypothetical protein
MTAARYRATDAGVVARTVCANALVAAEFQLTAAHPEHRLMLRGDQAVRRREARSDQVGVELEELAAVRAATHKSARVDAIPAFELRDSRAGRLVQKAARWLAQVPFAGEPRL